jgi:hypothetical protein
MINNHSNKSQQRYDNSFNFLYTFVNVLVPIFGQVPGLNPGKRASRLDAHLEEDFPLLAEYGGGLPVKHFCSPIAQEDHIGGEAPAGALCAQGGQAGHQLGHEEHLGVQLEGQVRAGVWLVPPAEDCLPVAPRHRVLLQHLLEQGQQPVRQVVGLGEGQHAAVQALNQLPHAVLLVGAAPEHHLEQHHPQRVYVRLACVGPPF